ncbi:enolase [Tanacetum coccineum]
MIKATVHDFGLSGTTKDHVCLPVALQLIGQTTLGSLSGDPLYYPSCQKVPAEAEAAIVTNIGTQFDLTPHMQSQHWADINAGIQQHLQKLYNTNKASLKAAHWVINPETGTYDVETIRQGRPESITPADWDAQIAFWNDPRNQARAAQNRQNRAKSTVVCRQGSRSLARLRDEMMESSATREYPSLIHTFFVTHTVNGVFTRDEDRAIYEEMLRLQALGSNTPSGVPYTEEEINALAQKGKYGSGGCGDDEMANDEDVGEDEEDEEDGDSVYEALELRDGGSEFRLSRKRCLEAANVLCCFELRVVDNVNSIIAPALIGKDPTEQTKIDNFMVQELDGTLGANAILAVSLAVCKAGASVKKIPLYKHIANLAGNKTLVLPVPAFNVINGDSHAGNKLAMQEFMILPVGASSFKEAMKMGVEVYHNLKSVIKKNYGQDATNVGDEGGFAPNFQENKEGLELLKTAIAKAGYSGKVVIGMDVAASEFYEDKGKTYDLNFKEENNDGSQKISGDSLKNVYKSFVSDYPIVSIEDPFDQDDWEHYAKMTTEIGEQVQIVGDDLLVTNPKRVEKAIKEKSRNALLLKVNQIGSVTELFTVCSGNRHKFKDFCFFNNATAGPPRGDGDRPRFGDRDGYRSGPRGPAGDFSGDKGVELQLITSLLSTG